jgi:hypothetical protein
MPDSTAIVPYSTASQYRNKITDAKLLYAIGVPEPPEEVKQNTSFDVALDFIFKGSTIDSSEKALIFTNLRIFLDKYGRRDDGGYSWDEVDSEPPSGTAPHSLQCGQLTKGIMGPAPHNPAPHQGWKALTFQIPMCIKTPGVYNLRFNACFGVRCLCVVSLARTILVTD